VLRHVASGTLPERLTAQIDTAPKADNLKTLCGY